MSKQLTIPTQFTAIDKFTPAVTRMGQVMQAFGSKAEVNMARAERAFNKMISPLSKIRNLLGNVGIYLGGYVIYRAVRDAIRIFADFEQANVDLALVMETTVQKNKAMGDQARMMALKYGSAATEVSKLQYELATLFGKDYDISKLVEPITTGAIALRTTPQDLGGIVGAILGAYKMDASQAPKVVDMLVKAANESALNFEKMRTMLPTNLKVSDLTRAGQTPTEAFGSLLAHLGILANAQVHVATAGTSLKNMTLDTNVANRKLDATLMKLSKTTNTLGASFKAFGKKSVVSAVVLEGEFKNLAELQDKILNKSQGLAESIASGRLNTLTGSTELARRAYEEFILSLNDGDGELGITLRRIVKLYGAIFLLSANTKNSMEAFDKLSPTIQTAAKILNFFLQLLIDVGIYLLLVKAGLLAWSAAIIVWTRLTWLADAALLAWNTGLITSVAVIGGSLIPLLGTIGGLLYIVATAAETVGSNWDDMVDAFSRGDIWTGLNKFANMIFDLILYPMQKLSEYLAKLTGIESFNTGFFKDVRRELGINVDREGGLSQQPQAVSTQTAQRDYMEKYFAQQRQNVSIDINDKTGRAKVASDNNLVPIQITSTQGPWWMQNY